MRAAILGHCLAGYLEIIYILSLVIPPPSAEGFAARHHHHRLMSFAAEQTARYNLASYNIEGVRPEDQHDNSLVIWLPKSAFEAVAYPDREGMMTTVGGGWCADVRNIDDGWGWFTSVKLNRQSKRVGTGELQLCAERQMGLSAPLSATPRRRSKSWVVPGAGT